MSLLALTVLNLLLFSVCQMQDVVTILEITHQIMQSQAKQQQGTIIIMGSYVRL